MIHRFENKDLGTYILVSDMGNGYWSVQTRDEETDEIVVVEAFFPSEQLATAYAVDLGGKLMHGYY